LQTAVQQVAASSAVGDVVAQSAEERVVTVAADERRIARESTNPDYSRGRDCFE